jgi:hypothetical protein
MIIQTFAVESPLMRAASMRCVKLSAGTAARAATMAPAVAPSKVVVAPLEELQAISARSAVCS